MNWQFRQFILHCPNVWKFAPGEISVNNVSERYSFCPYSRDLNNWNIWITYFYFFTLQMPDNSSIFKAWPGHRTKSYLLFKLSVMQPISQTTYDLNINRNIWDWQPCPKVPVIFFNQNWKRIVFNSFMVDFLCTVVKKCIILCVKCSGASDLSILPVNKLYLESNAAAVKVFRH